MLMDEMKEMDEPEDTDTQEEDKDSTLGISEPNKPIVQDLLKKEYWALKPAEECVDELIKKASEFYGYLTATGKMVMWRNAFEQMNKGFISLASISRGGIEGEMVHLPVNEFRNLIEHRIIMTTENKLAYQPLALNSDYQTKAQVTVARSVIDFYTEHKQMGAVASRAVEHAFLFGEGNVLKLWNENIGDIQAVEASSQKIFKKGDIQYVSLLPTDLIRDVHVGDCNENTWLMARLYVNKYELAAQYPDKAQDIIKHSEATDWDNSRLTNSHLSTSDLICLYLWFHKPTSAVPFGRQISFITKDCILEDQTLKYRDMPVIRLIPAATASLNFAYALAFDLLPLQQAYDILYQAVATNNVNFATLNILLPDGCNIGVNDLSGAMNLIKYNAQAGKPEALKLLVTPPEVYSFMDRIRQEMQIIAGVDSMRRGVPEDKITNGLSGALALSQSIHFNSTFQAAYYQFVGELATRTLHDLQDFATVPRLMQIVGKTNSPLLNAFTGEGVKDIDRIIVDEVNPFAKTLQGRVQMAQDLLQTGMMKNAQEYFEVVETGSLSSLMEGENLALLTVKKENEMLMRGEKPQVIATQDHVAHILGHNDVTADPELLNNPGPLGATVIQNTMAHQLEHVQALQTLNPILASILKLPVLPPPGAPAPEPNGPPQSAQGQPAPGQASPPAPTGQPSNPKLSNKAGNVPV